MLGAVPSLEWLGQALARKEAVASVRITGSPATLVDLFAHEAGIRVAGAARAKATDEARGILAALAQGTEEMTRGSNGPLISGRLLNRAHRRLMRGAAQARAPGRMRTIPTWIGGTSPGSATYVPPPPFEVVHLLKQLDDFVRHGLSHRLVRIALFQAQFENIHPYLDGNWRLCRVLVALLLVHWQLTRAPVLCLSACQARRRDDHERLLAAVRADGDWESLAVLLPRGPRDDGQRWTRRRAEPARASESGPRPRSGGSPGASVAGLRLFAQLPRLPIVTIPLIVKLLETTPPTAGKAVELLESIGGAAGDLRSAARPQFSYARFLEQLAAGMA